MTTPAADYRCGQAAARRPKKAKPWTEARIRAAQRAVARQNAENAAKRGTGE